MKKKVIAIVCVMFAVLICAGLFIFSSITKRVPENPRGTIGNTSGNLYNGGLFCESGGYVYFSNPYDSNALYCMRPDESEMKKLITTQVASINADGNYVYYYQGGSGGSAGLGFLISTTGIYRAKKANPKDVTCLDRVLGKYVILADNTVYYTSSDDEISLKSVGIDGSDKQTLLALDILPVSVQDGIFYYINNEDNLHLMAYNLGTKASRQVLTDDIYMPIIEGNTVYGIDIHSDYALVRLDIATGEKTLLDSDRTDLINLTDSYIYYQTSGKKPQLKRIRRDGSDMSVVRDGAYSNINATSNYVYFTGFGSTTPMYKTSAAGPVNVTTFDEASKAALEEISKGNK